MANIRNSISLQDRMSPVLRSILNSMDSMMKVMRVLDKQANKGTQSRAYKQAEASIRRANNQLIMMRNHAAMAAQGANDVADAWDGVSKSVNKSKLSFGNIFTSVASGIYTIQSAVRGISKVTGVADSALSDVAKLSLFNTSGKSDMEMYGQVYKTAQESRSGLSSTSNLAQRLLVSGTYEGEGATKSAIDLAGTINKALVLGGGTSQENDRAILQLSQALGSGVLQGDELRSIREQSPYFAKMLAEGLEKVDDKFIGTTIGDLKELGAQGELTSEVVVKALEAMSGQIAETFDEKAPRTFSGAIQSIGNTIQFFIAILNSAEGPLGQFNAALWDLADWLSTPQGFQFLSSIIPVLNIVVMGFQGLSRAIQFIGNNIQWIAPIFGTLLGLLAAYNTALRISKAITWATGVAQGIAAVAAYGKASADEKAALAASKAGSAAAGSALAFLADAKATSAATAAQHGFNAAMLASPLTWIIAIIIIVIGLIFLIVGIINKATGSTVSALGIIVGAVLWLVSVIWNTIVGVIDGIIQFLWTWFVEPFIGIIEWILNVCNGGFDSFGGAVANLIGNVISWFLSLGKVVTKIIDAIFGTDWTSGLNNLQDKVLEWGKNDNAITLSREAPSLGDIGIGRWASKDAWDTGYNFGAGIEESLGDFGNMDDLLGGLDDGLPVEVTGGQLDSIDSDVNISDEDIKLLRDMAARDYLLQVQSITPVAHVTFGDVRETADVNKIVEVIEQMVDEQMATALVG